MLGPTFLGLMGLPSGALGGGKKRGGVKRGWRGVVLLSLLFQEAAGSTQPSRSHMPCKGVQLKQLGCPAEWSVG